MTQKKKQITKEECAEKAWQLNVDLAKQRAKGILSGEAYQDLKKNFTSAIVSIRQLLWGIQRVWGTVMTLQHYDDPLNGSKVFAKYMGDIAKFTELAKLLSEKVKVCEDELCNNDNDINTIRAMASWCELGKSIIENCTAKPKETEENKK